MYVCMYIYRTSSSGMRPPSAAVSSERMRERRERCMAGGSGAGSAGARRARRYSHVHTYR